MDVHQTQCKRFSQFTCLFCVAQCRKVTTSLKENDCPNDTSFRVKTNHDTLCVCVCVCVCVFVCAYTLSLSLSRSGLLSGADPERIQSGSRADPEQIQSRSRADPEQIQSGSRADPERIQSGSRADPERIQSRSRADPEQIQSRSRADPEWIQSGLTAFSLDCRTRLLQVNISSCEGHKIFLWANSVSTSPPLSVLVRCSAFHNRRLHYTQTC